MPHSCPCAWHTAVLWSRPMKLLICLEHAWKGAIQLVEGNSYMNEPYVPDNRRQKGPYKTQWTEEHQIFFSLLSFSLFEICTSLAFKINFHS